jgi:hypothetical protein
MRDGGRLALAEFLDLGVTPVGLEQLRLDRLFELRAAIDSLRTEHDSAFRLGPCRDRHGR